MTKGLRYLFIAALIGVLTFQFNLEHEPVLQRRMESEQSVGNATTIIQETNLTSARVKPVVHTFYEPDPMGYCCGMLEEGHQTLLSVWRKSWEDKGWDTVVLTKEDSMRNPLFPAFQEKLETLRLSAYNQKCYWRWLAMATVGGGWMTDYDTMPLELTAEMGGELALKNEGRFTSYGSHVPCLMHGSREEWDRVIRLMMDLLPDKMDARASDMKMFQKLQGIQAKDPTTSNIGIIWRFRIVTAFPFKHDEDGALVTDCEHCKGKLAAHLSHKGTMDTFMNGLYPKEVSETVGVINGRGNAAKIFIDDYKSRCEVNEINDGLDLLPL